MNRKTVFDTVRRMLGRGFRQREIRALDAALDDAAAAASASDDIAAGSTGEIGHAGRQLIRQFEGCARRRRDGTFEAYPDPATGGTPWTIGWGATGPAIGPGTVWTREQCDARLERDLARFAREVAAALGEAPTMQAEFDAMVSFHYNTGAIGRATLTRLHIAGDHAGAAAQFARWNRAGGRIVAGLTRRREAEARLYRSARQTSVASAIAR